jgi:TonB family protein
MQQDEEPKGETAVAVPDDQKTATPAIGMKAYTDDLETRLGFPDTLYTRNRAVVVLTFSVLPDGSTDNFEVKKSPSQIFSDAAISAVQNGPEWIPAMKDGKYLDKKVRLKTVFKRE